MFKFGSIDVGLTGKDVYDAGAECAPLLGTGRCGVAADGATDSSAQKPLGTATEGKPSAHHGRHLLGAAHGYSMAGCAPRALWPAQHSVLLLFPMGAGGRLPATVGGGAGRL